MKLITTNQLTAKQHHEIHVLWNDEYPIKLKDRYSILLNDALWFHHYLLVNKEDQIVAWAVDFKKEEQVRFSIIVSSAYKNKGLGRRMLDALKKENTSFFGWVIDHDDDLKSNGEVYRSPLSFYLKNGFEVVHDQRLDTPMISAVLVKWSEQDKNT
jgi:GNAT superfamily N-acetyltransferase